MVKYDRRTKKGRQAAAEDKGLELIFSVYDTVHLIWRMAIPILVGVSGWFLYKKVEITFLKNSRYRQCQRS